MRTIAIVVGMALAFALGRMVSIETYAGPTVWNKQDLLPTVTFLKPVCI